MFIKYTSVADSVCEGGVPGRDSRRDVAAADLTPGGLIRHPRTRVGRHSLLRPGNDVPGRGGLREPNTGTFWDVDCCGGTIAIYFPALKGISRE